jgi:uncharacterized membrane protein YeaQ/YmgE (transglycosylase-associated protein family)
MEFLFYILAGAFVGWIASMIAGTNRDQGAIANITVGILGAFLGSFLVRAIGGAGVTGFDLTSFLVALLGAVILLFIYKAVRGDTTHHSSTLHR